MNFHNEKDTMHLNNATGLHFEFGMGTFFAYEKAITSGSSLYYPKGLTLQRKKDSKCYCNSSQHSFHVSSLHFVIFQNMISQEILDLVFHLNEEQNMKAL